MEIQEYNLPDDLHYEKNHFWVKAEDDLLVMGMTDFAQKMAGEVVYVQLPDEGKKLKTGKKFAKIESGKWLGKVLHLSTENWPRSMRNSKKIPA